MLVLVVLGVLHVYVHVRPDISLARMQASPNMIGLRLYWSLRVETNHPQFRER